MKKILAFLLALTMIFSAIPAFADESTAPTLPPVTTPVLDPVIERVIEAVWLYTGDTHALMTEVLDAYFQLSTDKTKKDFLSAYERSLTALAGYGEKIMAFGLTAKVLETLDSYVVDGSSAYDAFKVKDKATFQKAVRTNASKLYDSFTAAQLDNLSSGLTKFHPMAVKAVQIKADPTLSEAFNILGYNTVTTNIDKLIEFNIKKLIVQANLGLKLSLSYKDIEGAMQEMQAFYNGLTGVDRTLVYNNLKNQYLFFNLITVNPVTNGQTTVTGTVQPRQFVLAKVGSTELGDSASSASGSYTIGISPAAVQGQTITVQVYALSGGNVEVLDSTTVTVPAVVTPPTGGGGGGGGETTVIPEPVTPQGDLTTDDTLEIDEPDVALGDIPFIDVVDIEWARNEITKLYGVKVVTGKSEKIIDGQVVRYFNPHDTITRAEFAAMVSRLLQLNDDATVTLKFNDVKGSDWFYSFVKRSFISGLIKGYGENFRPNDTITRQEIATITGRILEIANVEKPKTSMLTIFKDLKAIAEWALDASELAVKEGIITGKPQDGGVVFDPTAKATRAEAAVMLYRLKGKVATVFDQVATAGN